MVFRKFRTGLVIRVLLLFACLTFFAWILVNTRFYISAIFLAIACLAQVYLIIRFADKTNERLARFFNAVRYDDFTQVFSSQSADPSMASLDREMNAVLESFRSIRKESEEQRLFLQNIIHHIGLALLVYDARGEIRLSNNAFRRLTGKSGARNVQALPEHLAELKWLMIEKKDFESGLIKILHQGELMQLSVSVNHFVLGEQTVYLATVQNIGRELNDKELESWLNLTRVLAHEIMNSMTPIISLASSAHDALRSIPENGSDQVTDARTAVETIERRGEGLLRFVETYRSITRLPRPDFKLISVQDIVRNVLNLMQEKLNDAGISSRVEYLSEEIMLTADAALVEQVLINLLINSMEALGNTGHPEITIRSGYDEKSRVFIAVEDNGKGILPEIRDHIFIPFFTTKRKGSGIGLSLSRQIMWLHKGNIRVESEPGKRTVFILRF